MSELEKEYIKKMVDAMPSDPREYCLMQSKYYILDINFNWTHIGHFHHVEFSPSNEFLAEVYSVNNHLICSFDIRFGDNWSKLLQHGLCVIKEDFVDEKTRRLHR